MLKESTLHETKLQTFKGRSEMAPFENVLQSNDNTTLTKALLVDQRSKLKCSKGRHVCRTMRLAFIHELCTNIRQKTMR